MAIQKTAAEPVDRYWATEPPEQMPALIMQRFRRYLEQLETRGLLATWRRSYRLYYGQDAQGGYATSHAVGFGGEQGEAIRVRSNHFRSLFRRYLMMATADRPAFDATAKNDGSDAQGQVQLVKQLLDDALDDNGGGMESHVVNAAEMTCSYAEGYVYQWWDVDRGEVVGVEQVPELGDDGQPVTDEMGMPRTKAKPVMSGDVVLEAFTPLNVARDLDAPPRSEPQWFIVLRWYKRWDLIAKYPEKRDDLLSVKPDNELLRGLWREQAREGSDWIPVFTLYHANTPAVAGGRMIEVTGDVWLTDGALAYGELPVHRIRPSSEMELDMAYSDFWDLIASQEAYDSVVSSLVTTHDVQNVPNLLAADGQDVNVTMMGSGGRLVTYKSDGRTAPPAWMPPPPMNEANLKLREVLLSDLETNSGINSVARGNPNDNTKSGASQALVQSMAQQYASAFVRAVAGLYRGLANARVRIWQRFATIERTVEIAGPDEAPIARSFKGSDIAGVRQVRVDLAPPLMRTLAGKMEIADKVLEAYGPKEVPASSYMTMLATGRLPPVYKRQTGQVRNIRSENERMSRGEPVEVLPTDNHYRHITEHACLLDDPEVRLDQARRGPVLQHIAQHAIEYDALRNEQPALWAITQEPLEPAMMEMMMALGAGAPANEPPMEPAANGPPAQGSGEPPAPRAAPAGGDLGRSGPLMPQNPQTGERTAPDGTPPAAGQVA
ncbi:MAG TPA: hypothetical protein VM513_27680 [Kofleriaceae bacterium]|jgi:hypothetical protein|nr:hypothetical protein [Kofleriaceae bacterium]